MKISAFFKNKVFTKSFLYDFLLGLAAFAIPLIALIILYSVNNYTLASHKGFTIIGFDLQSQYIAIMRNYKYILTHQNESLVYSTMRNMGGEYLSIFSYYVSSPFNLFIVFVQDVDIPLFFIWTNIIKMSFAAFNMYLLLRLTTKEKNIGYLAFAFGYGLVSYFFANMHNFMWFDCVMILPLVILGVRYLEQGKHHWLYALSLAYALMTSWYIGALMCMFLVIFFVYRVICLDTKKERINYAIRFGATSVAGGFLAAAFWFTAFMHLAGTKARGGLSTPDFASFSLFFRGFLSNDFPSVDVLMNNCGWATMFTSIVTLIFAQLFVLNPSYNKKERYGALGIFILYFFVLEVSTLNELFHGGQEPSWFPTRYSFMLGFLVCYFGALEFRKLKETKEWHLAIPAIAAVIVLIIVVNVPSEILSDDHAEYYNPSVLSIVLYYSSIVIILGYLLLKRFTKLDNKWVYMGLSTLILALTAVSSTTSASTTLKEYEHKNYEHAQRYETYLLDCAYQDAVNKVKALEPEDNYRMEITSNRPGNYNLIDNNPFFYNYNGLSHYTSQAKKAVQLYFEKLGFHNNGFFEKFEGGGTLATSSLLGLKYLIDENYYSIYKPKYTYHYPFVQLTDMVSADRDVQFYKNEYALPFGFAVGDNGYSYINQGERQENGNIRWFDHFEYFNEIFKTFVKDVKDSDDKQKDIFKKCEISEIEVGEGLTYTEDEFGNRYFTGKGIINYVMNEPEVNEDDNIYFYNKKCDWRMDFFVDGTIADNNNYWHTGIRGIKHRTNGIHKVKVQVEYDVNNTLIVPEMYIEKVDVLGEYINKIKAQSANDLKVKKTKFSYGLEGSFELLNDNQMFVFTLPFEKDFKIYVDGKRVKAMTKWDIFTGVELKDYAHGKHTIKLVYTDNSFTKGLIISYLGLSLLVGIILLEKDLSNKKKKISE